MPQIIGYTHGNRLLTDKGFSSSDNRSHLRKHDIRDNFSHQAVRDHPLKWSQRLVDKMIAGRRFRIEQAFGTLKRKFCMKALCFNLNKALRKIVMN